MAQTVYGTPRLKATLVRIFQLKSKCTILNQFSLEINPLKPRGQYMYHQFNIQQFYVLPHTVYLCVLCGSQNKQRLFPYITLTDWFV